MVRRRRIVVSLSLRAWLDDDAALTTAGWWWWGACSKTALGVSMGRIKLVQNKKAMQVRRYPEGEGPRGTFHAAALSMVLARGHTELV
jgi:hypothetical protein